jgi:hypothetical protein
MEKRGETTTFRGKRAIYLGDFWKVALGFMPDAQRLCWPSRKVVSTKDISLTVGIGAQSLFFHRRRWALHELSGDGVIRKLALIDRCGALVHISHHLD